MSARIVYRRVVVDGVTIFYREAGPEMAETILLLHGFPTSSHLFRNLIPLLSERYRVVAPDFPGFGQSDMPARDRFTYTFDNISKLMTRFTETVGLDRFAMYIFDYGAPIGLRMAVEHPERVTAIISQNGNAYEEGLSDGWNPIRKYWLNPTNANRDALRSFLSPESTIWQYMEGVPDKSLVSPDGYSLDNYYLSRPGADDVQLDLFLDYASNVSMYPTFQQYFREKQPPLLAVWGCNDPYLLPAGAEAYKRDNPNAQVRLLDTGHFALETHNDAIAAAMVQFFASQPSGVRGR
jgi:pimeloyl-ACP methyl ester carboxylesterase